MTDAAAQADTPDPGDRRCLLILNERSRSGAALRGTVLDTLRSEGVELIGGAPFPLEELEAVVRRFGANVPDRILVGGGDGTLNAALPVLLRLAAPTGVLPLGTANDFACSLGIPLLPREAVRVALEGRVRRVDVGRVDGRPFLNVASLGLGAKVTEHLTAELKARLGFLGYPRAMLAAYREARPFRARIWVDDERLGSMRCIHLAVGNAPRYGGGALIAEDARPDDGRLYVFALAPLPLWRLLLLAPRLGRGRHRDLSGALTRKAARVRVETSRPLPISADGEIVSRTPATFDLLPAALAVLVPRGGKEG